VGGRIGLEFGLDWGEDRGEGCMWCWIVVVVVVMMEQECPLTHPQPQPRRNLSRNRVRQVLLSTVLMLLLVSSRLTPIRSFGNVDGGVGRVVDWRWD
jgi:hypothetical protein